MCSQDFCNVFVETRDLPIPGFTSFLSLALRLDTNMYGRPKFGPKLGKGLISDYWPHLGQTNSKFVGKLALWGASWAPGCRHAAQTLYLPMLLLTFLPIWLCCCVVVSLCCILAKVMRWSAHPRNVALPPLKATPSNSRPSWKWWHGLPVTCTTQDSPMNANILPRTLQRVPTSSFKLKRIFLLMHSVNMTRDRLFII